MNSEHWQAEVDRLTIELHAARGKLQDALEQEAGVRVGDIVKATISQRRKKVIVEARVARIEFWLGSKSKPRLMCNIRKKDGEWSNSTRTVFGEDWSK